MSRRYAHVSFLPQFLGEENGYGYDKKREEYCKVHNMLPGKGYFSPVGLVKK